MLDKIRDEVTELLGADTSGHSIDHVERVVNMALAFSEHEDVDVDEVALTAYLHDVDDYKLFGAAHAEALTNAHQILDRHSIDKKLAQRVLLNISTMGYSKSLEGIRPTSLEGKIVSDADMCDAIGARGLIRIFDYNTSKGRPFFVPSISPVSEAFSADEYRAQGNEHAVQHFFDKLLKIPDMMMTDAGKIEATRRKAVMEHFLKELFREERATEWQEYFEAFKASR